MSVLQEVGTEDDQKDVWAQYKKILKKYKDNSIDKFVEKLRLNPKDPSYITNIAPKDKIEMLISIGLSSIPYGQNFRNLLAEKLGDKTEAINFKNIIKAFKSITKKDLKNEQLENLRKNVIKRMEEEKIENPFGSRITLEDFSFTSHLLKARSQVNIGKLMGIESKAIKILKESSVDEDSFLENQDEEISKKFRINVDTVTKIKRAMIFKRNLEIGDELALVLSQNFDLQQLALVKLDKIKNVLNNTKISVPKRQHSMKKLEELQKVAKAKFPKKALLYHVITDLKLKSIVNKYIGYQEISCMDDLKKNIIEEGKSMTYLELILSKIKNKKKNQLLKAHIRLGKLSNNYELNKALIERNLTTSHNIARIPLLEFQSKFKHKASKEELKTIYYKAQEDMTRNITLGSLATSFPKDYIKKIAPKNYSLDYLVVKSSSTTSSPENLYNVVEKVLSDTDTKSFCECERCESAYAPAAYLLALIRFIEHYFSTISQVRDMDYLFGRMQRKYLAHLAITCEEVQKMVSQPKIAKRVLLNYIKERTNTEKDKLVYEALGQSLNPSPFFYYNIQFKEYLKILGISFEEIHSMFLDPGFEETISLQLFAEKLGISTVELNLIRYESDLDAIGEVLCKQIIETEILDAAINEDKEFFKDMFDIRDKDEELDEIINETIGDDKEPFDLFINLNFFGLNGEISSIDIPTFKKMFQMIILKKVLNIDITEFLILIDHINPADFSLIELEKIDKIYSMLVLFGLNSIILKELLEQDTKLNQIANYLQINRDILEIVLQVKGLNDINSINDLFVAWDFIQLIRNINISVGNFIKLKCSLVENSADPLLEILGVILEDLVAAINSESDEELAEILNISIEDLKILYDFQIKDENGVHISNAEIIRQGGISYLELIHRPVRVAGSLGLNLNEFKTILGQIVDISIFDPNGISYEQILLAFNLVNTAHSCGLNIMEIGEMIKGSTELEIETLMNMLGVDDQWWQEYITNFDQRIEKLSNQLNYPQDQIEFLVEQLGSVEHHYIKSVSSEQHKLYLKNEIMGDYSLGNWKLCIISSSKNIKYYPLISYGTDDDPYFEIDEEPIGILENDIANVINDDDNLNWIQIENDPIIEQKTDILRRWIRISQEIENNIEILYFNLINYKIDFEIDEINNFYALCMIAFDSSKLLEIIEALNWDNTFTINDFNTIERLRKVHHLIIQTKSLDLNIDILSSWNLWEDEIKEDDVDELKDLMKSRFEKDQYESEIENADKKILEKTRDALLYYAISPNIINEWPQTAKGLSNELLIDLKTSASVYTNEILQAIESLQTYIVRVQTGQELIVDLLDRSYLSYINSFSKAEELAALEPQDGPIVDDPSKGYGDQMKDYDIGEITAEKIIEKREQLGGEFTDISQLSEIEGVGQDKLDDLSYSFRLTQAPKIRGDWWQNMKKDWKWLQRYVLWEAAQKVFLYPENYIMPELRDDKSPFFIDLEDELSQGEVTQTLSEKAISGYIDKVHTISSLRITGTFYDSDKKVLHLFARSQIGEKETYYRYFKNQRIWSPWIKASTEINSDKLYPFWIYNRIYLFWIETETKGDDDKPFKHNLCFCYSLDMKNWSEKKTFELIQSGFPILPDKEFLWLGIYQSTPSSDDVGEIGGIDIYLNAKPPLLKWERNLFKLRLACNDNIVFIPAGETNKEKFSISDFKFDFTPDSIDTKETFFWKDKTSSEAVIGYYKLDGNERPWPGKATYSRLNNFVNFLYHDDSNIKLITSLYLETKIPHMRSFIPQTIFSDVDETFKIDDAIAIGDNSYFYCSDQLRCFLIIVHNEFDYYEWKLEQKFSICQLNYGNYCKLKDTLFQEGLEKLYDPDLQTMEITQDYKVIYNISPELNLVQYPPRTIEFYGPNKIYNWELFFHVPFLIAESLNQNRKFELAVEWYNYIFNPYIKPESSHIDKGVTWKFKPFKDDLQEQFTTYIKDIGDIDIWRKDPFNPHAIARVRPFTYQKSVLLSYIENLLEWADQDFTRDTQESINLARNRFSFLDTFLELPEFEEFIPCIKETRTLRSMNEASIWESSITLTNAEDYTNINVNNNSIINSCLLEEWADPIDTIIDPYSLEAMLINIKVGCIPENPIFKSHRQHLKANLRKIRTGRNIAGIKRILPLFEAAVDPMSIIKVVSSGLGFENLNISSIANLSPYRFPYLIERAKSLANLVAQAGNVLLLAIEKKETEELAFLKAQQGLKLAKANIHLRKLRIAEAEDSLTLAVKQTERATKRYQRYTDLISADNIELETDALQFLTDSISMLEIAKGQQRAAAISSLIPTVSVGYSILPSFSVSYGGSNIAGFYGSLAGESSSEAAIRARHSTIASMKANFFRREQEWIFQQTLALLDQDISQQNQDIANDRIAIAKMEHDIAEMQAEFADETLEFLKEKFTNKELYKWMVKILSKILYGFYNLAYTAARMAQATMEFERNEIYDFISYGYWDSEKKGLLSGDQLLLDINRMDEAYIQNNARKLEITKYISLGLMVPEALIELRSRGKTTFTIPMEWFDRDFPGHYQRIIKTVRLSLLALVGPASNVNATLSTVSPSQVILSTDNEPILLQRIQSVALSGASNSSGLFELNYRDERYLPFEGCGVAVTWEIEMPKASNKFDFQTIIDVILTLDYTALSDSEYKLKIIEHLGTEVGGMIPISIRDGFPDAWYHFHNPIFNPANEHIKLYSFLFNINRKMFPPNEEEHSLDGVILQFGLDDPNIRIPLNIKYTSEKGQIVNISRRTGSNGILSLENDFKRLYPFGQWEIGIDWTHAPESLWAKDDQGNLIMVKNVGQDTESPLLNTEKIASLIIGLSYEANLEWPPED